ncbi:MAG: ferredoxin reductase family protein [Nitrospirota bacterium]
MKPAPFLPVTLALALAGLPAVIALPAVPQTAAGAGVWLGWLGAGLLSVSLVLMVREPGFAAWFGGLERMYRWHHALGTVGYALILAHPLALAAQFLPRDPQGAWRILSPFTRSWTAGLGWLALLGLVAGLAVTYGRRLRYSLWRPLHASLGLGVMLGLAHVVTVGGWSVSAWLLIASAGLALSWRVWRADRGGGARPYEVSTVSHPSRRLSEVTLRPLATPLAVAPGQFVMVAFFEGPHYRGCGEYHPFTASYTAPDGALTVDIKDLGDCTRHIQSLEAGVAARVQGPYGTFLADRPEAPELWIAGGIGVTPFLAALRAGPVTRSTEFIYLSRELRDAAYLDELNGYAAGQPLLHVRPLVMQEDPTPLFAMLATVSDLPGRHAYLCGPPPLITAVTKWLRQHGTPQSHIHFERFDFR